MARVDARGRSDPCYAAQSTINSRTKGTRESGLTPLHAQLSTTAIDQNVIFNRLVHCSILRYVAALKPNTRLFTQ
jgi:hypothetical protein